MRAIAIILMCAASLAGCAAVAVDPAPPQVVQALPTARSSEALIPQPANGHAMNVGIYGCIDSTGQKRKGPPGVADFSSAVPQDCAPFLMAAMRALPHYRVLERARVDDILKERQLATVMLGEKTRSLLGNMLIADVLMLGQIVSYDRTVSQVAGGIAVNAVGLAHQRVSDSFTFSLRVVSTKSGEVLNEVLVQKSVESLQLNGHVLRIIGVDTASAEAGSTANEPSGIALQQAVQLAVRTITEKGMDAGWWSN
jgi:curli production assembly/transport component CsgG